MSFKLCTCVLGLFRMLSVVSFCFMFFGFLHLSIVYVAHVLNCSTLIFVVSFGLIALF